MDPYIVDTRPQHVIDAEKKLTALEADNAALRAQIEALTKLRRMSDLPDPELDEVVLYRKDYETGKPFVAMTAHYDHYHQNWFNDSGFVKDASKFAGWLPIPSGEGVA